MRVLTAISLFTSIASAAYIIQDDYTPNSFASMFDFFTDADPTDGYVNYVDQSTAQSSGLYKVENNQVYMGVDSTNVASGRGRNSIRISSKNTYNHGLIILDLAHMPGGACGTWPAFWLLGPNWPNSGEIDIIEGVNTQTTNEITLHTNAGCSITNTGNFAGQLETSNCDVNAPNQATNAGCSINSTNTQSYGTGFNDIGGGVYATQWTSQAITVWFFPRSAIPSDITSGTPNPANWGLPSAQFTGACDIDEHIVNQQIVFDVTFCGQWAGAVWDQNPTCKAQADTCQDFVANHPTAFQDTYWSINGLKVYQDNGASAPSGSSSSYSASTTTGVLTPLTPSTFATVTRTITDTTTTPVVPTTTSTVAFTTPTLTLTLTPTLSTTTSYPAAATTTIPAPASSATQSPTGSWQHWNGNQWNTYGPGHNNNGPPKPRAIRRSVWSFF